MKIQKMKKAQLRFVISASLSVFLTGCGAPGYSPSEMHITYEEVESNKPVAPQSIPSLVKSSPISPALGDFQDSETYDVVVTKVPVRDLLFALARDSGVNMDVDSRVGGVVTMSALDQTLDAILERIKHQVNIRIDKVGEALIVKPDEPYYKKYHIDFISLGRTFSSTAESSGVGEVGEATLESESENNFWLSLEKTMRVILSSATEEGEVAGVSVGLEDDSSLSEAEKSENKFSELSNFDLNKDSGLLLVYAPERLQKEVQSYLDDALSIAKRQVLLEATIVEVVLNNQYNQGIDWSLFNSLAKEGLGLYQGSAIGGSAAAVQVLTNLFTRDFGTRKFSDTNGDGRFDSLDGSEYTRYLEFRDEFAALGPHDSLVSSEYEEEFNEADSVLEVTASKEVEELNENSTARISGGLAPNTVGDSFFTAAFRGGDISAAVQLLDAFGDAKVLSSPRISALNNQPAILRVVDQEVYFNIEVSDTVNESTGQVTGREYVVEENIVDVGFVMNVLPQISSNDEIVLNLKPAVTRVLEYRSAPVPAAFAGGGGNSSVQNLVPITRVRELDSIISLRDGEVAVLGGLLEDRTSDNNRSVPGLSSLPGIGSLFENINQTTFKTEFVVFIKAKVIKNPSINGDYSEYKKLLPSSDFIHRDRGNTYLPPKQSN